MHELSLVDELVTECSRLADGREVLEVFVHCAQGTDTAEVAECFAFLTSHHGPSVMSQACLKMVTVPARGKCKCGFSGELAPDVVAGHMFVCPGCGTVGDQGAALQLMAMTFRGARSGRSSRSAS